MAHFRFNLFHDHVTVGNVDKKRLKIGKLLIFACFFMYMCSMAVKGVFAAEISYIQKLWSIGYTQTSVVNASYFITYGLVQVFIFIFARKMNMRRYLLFTVPLSAVCAILMGTSSDVMQMCAYFGLAGALQAGIFCGCNFILTKYLPTQQLTTANRFMNFGYSIGSVIAYLLCAMCVTYDLWQLPYFILGGIFLVSVILFLVIAKHAERYLHLNEILDARKTNKKVVREEAEDETIVNIDTKKKTAIFYILDLSFTFIISAIYYCIMNNLTPLLAKEFGLGESVAIYISIIAPIAITIGPMITISACNKDNDFIRQSCIFTLMIVPIPLFLAFFYKASLILTLALTLIFVVLANGVKAVGLSIITFKMRKQLNSGAYSAISNAAASVSAGVTPTLIGTVLDNFGWKSAYLVTFTITLIFLIALIIVDLLVRKANKKRKTL